jgi:hypothetical protein
VAAALQWTSLLIFPAGNGNWVPTVDLTNIGEEPVEVSGGQIATGVLLHPDRTPVRSRRSQPYTMPAMLKVYRIRPGERREIAIGLSLLETRRPRCRQAAIGSPKWNGVA